VRGNRGGADRPGLSGDGGSDPESWYAQDPLDSSCPPEYIGVPLAEIFAAADAAATEAASAPPEAADAGYLHGTTPPGPPPVPPAGPAAGFASRAPLDLALPGVALASFCEEATGDDGRARAACDDELIGLLRAWQRIESWASARRLAVTAELIRRRPAAGCAPQGPAELPSVWGKFCADELALTMAISARAGCPGRRGLCSKARSTSTRRRSSPKPPGPSMPVAPPRSRRSCCPVSRPRPRDSSGPHWPGPC
jgi:hypothetical protein